MVFLNLGCGTKTSRYSGVVNIDWSVYARLKHMPLTRLYAPIFLRGERLAKWQAMSSNVLVHNLRKGIPFASNSVDVVYHSHVLEHIDRNAVGTFLAGIKRVLKPSGIHHILMLNLAIPAHSRTMHP